VTSFASSSPAAPAPIEVEHGVTAGDYLRGFLIGTREALYSNDRQSLKITIRAWTRDRRALSSHVRAAVGSPTSLIHITPTPPGVEAGTESRRRRPQPAGKSHRPLLRAPQTAGPGCRRNRAAQSPRASTSFSKHLSLKRFAQNSHAPPIRNDKFTRMSRLREVECEFRNWLPGVVQA